MSDTTTDLVEFLQKGDFTDIQAYNLIINDLYQFVPIEEVEGAQRLVAYFMDKILAVCLPAIRAARASSASSSVPAGIAGSHD